jgi:hypothetical protein
MAHWDSTERRSMAWAFLIVFFLRAISGFSPIRIWGPIGKGNSHELLESRHQLRR